MAMLWELWPHGFALECGGHDDLVHLRAPANVVQACAFTCGYFVSDSLLMLLFPKETSAGLGGSSAYTIMWIHHLVSLVVWPYTMYSNVCVVFVAYYISTEVTNIGQNIFSIGSKGKLLSKGAELPVALAWFASFFVFRVLPAPFVLLAYVRVLVLQGGCGISTAELVTALITVPVPIALNLFWFRKMVRKGLRMIKGTDGKPQGKGT
jgi:hypothetical protein